MKLRKDQTDSLQKLFQTGVDRASDMLGYISESPVSWELQPLEILTPLQLRTQLQESLGAEEIVAMELVFSGEFQGTAQLVFPRDSAALLVNTIANEERRMLDRDALRKETLIEIGNIFFNGIMGAISTVVERGITYMIPTYREGTVKQLLSSSNSKAYAIALLTQVHFKIDLSQENSQQQLHSFSRILPAKYLKLFVDKSQTGKPLTFFLKVNTLENLLSKLNNVSNYFD